MPPTMQAQRFEGLTNPGGLHLRTIPIPEPGPHEALIRVEAAGLCHSDTTLLTGGSGGAGAQWSRAPPLTLGHEVAGTVVKLGDGEEAAAGDGIRVGDAVAVANICHPLEYADYTKAIGLGFDGGYAQYALAPRALLTRLPDGVGFAQAAAATDSITTAYHAVVAEGRVREGMAVAVVGLGGLGLNGVAVASLKGARVYGVDVEEGKFEDARRAGAVECVRDIAKLDDVVLDVVLDFVGKSATVAAAVTAVRPGGRVVLVGLGAAVAEVPVVQFVMRGIALQGSIGASKEELVEVLKLIAAGKLTPKLTEIPFVDVEKGLRALDGNQVSGRLFTCPNKTSVSSDSVQG